MSNTIVKIAPVGGTIGKITGAAAGPISVKGIGFNFPVSYIPTISGPLPKQIIGLVPLMPCDYSDCRDQQSLFCFLNPVFATSGEKNSTYKNDMNSFFLDYAGTGVVQFIIEKQTNNFFATQGTSQWVDKATVSDNTYGIYYPIGTISGHPTYTGLTINWATILTAFGPGIYRISVNVCKLLSASATFTASFNDFPSSVTGGSITIGAWSMPVFYTDVSIALNYFAALINSSGICTATVSGSNLIINGPKGTKVIFTYPTGHGGNFTFIWALAGGTTPVVGDCVCALQSLPFILKAFNCDMAHGTVKFEAWRTGVQGDIDNDGNLFDLCGITIYDSIRARGFFGETNFDDDVVQVEWGLNNINPFGLVENVRDKTVRNYKLDSYYWPQWLLNRIYVYAFTGSNPLLVSDYNRNNSDYFLQQRNVVKADGLKPEYLDKNNFDPTMRTQNRTGIVTVKFKQGIQGLISSIMCQQVVKYTPS